MFTKSARFYDAIYRGIKDYAAEASKIDATIRARAPEAKTLLDVACGTGMHLEHLAKSYQVEGLDLDPELLAIARERLPDVPFHVGNMVTFDLGRRFDAVTCLFSSIGYARTVSNLARAVATMASHLGPGGVLVVEPWFSPERWEPGRVDARFIDEPGLKIARINTTERRDRLSIISFEYLVGTREGFERFSERHELGLFTDDEYREAFAAAGLAEEHDPEGLMGRGLYLGRR